MKRIMVSICLLAVLLVSCNPKQETSRPDSPSTETEANANDKQPDKPSSGTEEKADDKQPDNASSGSEEKTDDKEQWPETIEEAVAIIISEMSDEDKATIRNTKRGELIKYHHGWGTGIRNEFGLWGGNAALMKDTGSNHPDSASMVIINAVWLELQKDK